eukprot:CAMPEP_0201475776 /NCGR_PEP_ID=MMETSP0151_2-20130828/1141_1 /ASSEMBLY_ACC=CAM_ASM_000257 /TAXON_ID=200890 /ORGANISM="Paramoeba atlantica, Strain 621/1 / CCAP 1560/9" /LENGTH=90 /DNA_ID=CAMNT_0047855963 /DNA_START=356 /DNA_END=628 /DNA_ORIENTATION=-
MKSSSISGARDDILVYRPGPDGCNEITIFVDTLQQTLEFIVNGTVIGSSSYQGIFEKTADFKVGICGHNGTLLEIESNLEGLGVKPAKRD